MINFKKTNKKGQEMLESLIIMTLVIMFIMIALNFLKSNILNQQKNINDILNYSKEVTTDNNEEVTVNNSPEEKPINIFNGFTSEVSIIVKVFAGLMVVFLITSIIIIKKREKKIINYNITKRLLYE